MSSNDVRQTLPCRLHSDQRGAIMMIALFAAFSLSGALFALIGIGNAVVFHDKGQEIADAAALSSAAVHARAMNATAAMNFVMLVMVGAYLSFAVVADLALITAAYIVGVPFAEKSGEKLGDKAHHVFATLVRFEQTVASTFAALDQAQSALAVGAPALGTLAGREVAAPRKHTAMSLGWSNFPYATVARPGERLPHAPRPMIPNEPLKTPDSCKKGGSPVCKAADKLFPVLKSPPPWNPGPNNGRSLGLPIAAEPASSLCIRVGALFFKDFGEAIDPFELGEGAEETMKHLKARPKKLPITVHCSDDVNRNVIGPIAGVARTRDVWTVKGPKRMTAANGDMALRVLAWSTTIDPDVLDESVQKVKIAGYDFTGATDRSTLVYDAQAEFFYDCTSTWENPACHGGEIADSGVGYEQTLYWMNWRARLTRVRTPSRIFGSALGSVMSLGGTVVNRAGAAPGAWSRVSDRFRDQNSTKAPSIH